MGFNLLIPQVFVESVGFVADHIRFQVDGLAVALASPCFGLFHQTTSDTLAATGFINDESAESDDRTVHEAVIDVEVNPPHCLRFWRCRYVERVIGLPDKFRKPAAHVTRCHIIPQLSG